MQENWFRIEHLRTTERGLELARKLGLEMSDELCDSTSPLYLLISPDSSLYEWAYD